jgi:hypothetical protein
MNTYYQTPCHDGCPPDNFLLGVSRSSKPADWQQSLYMGIPRLDSRPRHSLPTPDASRRIGPFGYNSPSEHTTPRIHRTSSDRPSPTQWARPATMPHTYSKDPRYGPMPFVSQRASHDPFRSHMTSAPNFDPARQVVSDQFRSHITSDPNFDPARQVVSEPFRSHMTGDPNFDPARQVVSEPFRSHMASASNFDPARQVVSDPFRSHMTRSDTNFDPARQEGSPYYGLSTSIPLGHELDIDTEAGLQGHPGDLHNIHEISVHSEEPFMDDRSHHSNQDSTSLYSVGCQHRKCGSYHSIGCQPSFAGNLNYCAAVSPTNVTTIVTKEVKFILPAIDISKTPWSEIALKISTSLIECDMGGLLQVNETTSQNAKHSKILMIELYKKLTGSALQLFTSLEAQKYYMEGGRGIEMLRELATKFNPMDANSTRILLGELESLKLQDHQDLGVYFGSMLDIAKKLGWHGQSVTDEYLVHLAMSQLGKESRYKSDIEMLQLSQAANQNSFATVDELMQSLFRLDSVRGLPYGGAATKKISTPTATNNHSKYHQGRSKQQGLVSSVVSKDDKFDESKLTMHPTLAWIGAVDLDESWARKKKHTYSCPICNSNNHKITECVTMSGWIMTKKIRGPNKIKGTVAAVMDDTATTQLGQANSVRFGISKIKRISAGAASVLTSPNVFAPLAEADSTSDDENIDFDIVAGVHSADA